MKPAMSAAALSAGEASLEEGPSLAIPGSRPPSPMVTSNSSRRFSSRERELQGTQCLMSVFGTTSAWGREFDSGSVSASGSREASSERRARESSPACREALMRTRGVLTAARTRVVELEGQLEKLQQEKTAQDVSVRELQDQVKSLQAQMLERSLDARRSPRKAAEITTPSTVRRRSCRSNWTGQDMCSECCSPLPFASPLQVCEAAVARLEGLFERSSLLRSSVLEWRVKTLEARRQRGLVSSCATSSAAYFEEFRAKTCVAWSNSEVRGAGSTVDRIRDQPTAQQSGLTGRQRRRRVCPGALRLVAATATRCETATVLLVWTAWWSLWRGRHLKARMVGESRSGFSAIGRRVNDSLQVAWTRWQDMVEANAYFRRISAAHVSRCEALRMGATALVEASSHRQAALLTLHAWLAWRNLCRCQALRVDLAQRLTPDEAVRRTCFQVWLIATKAAFTERFRVAHASHVRRSSAANQVLIAARSWCDSDLVKACLGAWRSCALLTRQGRLHRMQLLEVLAPQCALVRMCLAVWNRSACDSRMQAWIVERQQAATIRCQALDALSTMMTRSSEVTVALVFLAWSSWRLRSERREDRRRASHFADSQAALQIVQRDALASLKVAMWRDLNLAMAKIAWKAWYMLAATSGPRFPAESADNAPSGMNSSILSPRRQSPFKSPLKRGVTRQANINGRPPSAATSSLIGGSQSFVSGAPAQPQPPLRLTLEVVQQRSQQLAEDQGSMRAMRHVRSDPSLCTTKPPSSSPVTHEAFQSPSARSRVTSLAGRLNVPLTSQSLAAPVSSRSSASTATSTRTDSDIAPEWKSSRRPSLASFLESTNQWHPKQGVQCTKSLLNSTPRDGGLSISDRSTCCSSTPRSLGGGPDNGPPASCPGSSPERQAFGPACQQFETPLPQSKCVNASKCEAFGPACQKLETPLPQSKCVNASKCEEDVLRTPVGPMVSPSPGGVAGRVLHRSASSVARTLVASDLIRPMTRSNSSQFRLQPSPQTSTSLIMALPIEAQPMASSASRQIGASMD